MRKAAQYIFTTPPSSSYDEVLRIIYNYYKRRRYYFLFRLYLFFKKQRKVCGTIYLCKIIIILFRLTVSPGFYSSNWLFIGKCYLSLGKKDEARVWLEKAANYTSDVLMGDDNEVSVCVWISKYI